MPVSRRTRAEHHKHISKVQKFIDGVVFYPKSDFVVTNMVSSTVTIPTGDFSNVHNFVENFVWDPTQITYFSKPRGASFAPKIVRK
jgi:hypothetical protein